MFLFRRDNRPWYSASHGEEEENARTIVDEYTPGATAADNDENEQGAM